MIAHTGEILNPSSPNENHRVFLEVMTDPRDIGGDFKAGS
jgi:hypothetical protein